MDGTHFATLYLCRLQPLKSGHLTNQGTFFCPKRVWIRVCVLLCVVQASEFRTFWGEKAELRRFQDGSINEAVVWRGGSVGERRGVVTQVITHLLNR